MSFDRSALMDTCRLHGKAARVVIARLRGSGPREVGAAMLVWRDGFSGTIGGGTLEFQAMQKARDLLETGTSEMSRHALGPDLGQCCGGSVDLLTEVFDVEAVEKLPTDVVIRGSGAPPLAIERVKAKVRNSGYLPKPQLISDWMVEPVIRVERKIWIWGAGHVGRALIGVLSPVPGLELTWIDFSRNRFPEHPGENHNILVADKPEALVAYAPQDTEHLIVTYSHDLDLELCHRLLGHGFTSAGLIGSATKWARFRSRLCALGHTEASIDRISCPIGDPSLGKHPQAIALGVATQLLRKTKKSTELKGYG